MEDFCKTYDNPSIMKAFRQQRDFFTNEVTDFIKMMMDKISQWTIEPVKLMISIAVVHCNSIFELLPKIIDGANPVNKPKLLEFMAYQARFEFSSEVSKWLNQYYKHINDRTFLCCRGLKWNVDQNLHQATLFVSLFVNKCNYKSLSNINYMVVRYPSIYQAMKTKILEY